MRSLWPDVLYVAETAVSESEPCNSALMKTQESDMTERLMGNDLHRVVCLFLFVLLLISQDLTHAPVIWSSFCLCSHLFFPSHHFLSVSPWIETDETVSRCLRSARWVSASKVMPVCYVEQLVEEMLCALGACCFREGSVTFIPFRLLSHLGDG